MNYEMSKAFYYHAIYANVHEKSDLEYDQR